MNKSKTRYAKLDCFKSISGMNLPTPKKKNINYVVHFYVFRTIPPDNGVVLIPY